MRFPDVPVGDPIGDFAHALLTTYLTDDGDTFRVMARELLTERDDTFRLGVIIVLTQLSGEGLRAISANVGQDVLSVAQEMFAYIAQIAADEQTE